ncbi:ABC transporter permease (plasmid) [Lichenicola cladoniae]|uniref:ABC transporter permease n=1 Tax=Lichenicola cladoniae TaxID=1484109 RepID=A0A6M8HYL9_9PROT|nr:ABC transporter permease [Lichenicola cladoniae]NPD70096.1 ABC transporter permease [Acetobacteraceae bacterium]QKE93639.1 ABC transporter permease [Lichenicola cladoniae]
MSGVVAAPARNPGETRQRMVALVQSRGAIVVLVVAALAAGLAFPSFPRPGNVNDIIIAASFLGLVAIGQTLVVIMGGFDLSVGSMVGLGTVLAAYAAPYGVVAAFAAPMAAGLLVGLIDGLLIVKARMAPFIVTLAALLALKGLAVMLAGESLVIADPGWFGRIANGQWLGVGNLVVILFVAYGIAALVLNRTRFGAAVFAIGGNEEASRMLGVRVERVKIATYCVSGTLAGLAGALLAARLSSGLSSAGTGYELQSIAAAVIGGVLLTGGVGTMLGALSGVLLLGVIENVINQIGSLSAAYQGLASGAFLLLAVIVQSGLTRQRAG